MKNLVLLGGGHAHVEVLGAMAKRPFDAGFQVHLVTPYRRQIYSGMLPGWIAGHYELAQCVIPLDTLAARAGAAFHETAVDALNLGTKSVHGADGTRLEFDLLSIDTGPVASLDQLPGAEEHALPLRPIERFVAAWPALIDRVAGQCKRFDLAILGAGAGGVELAFAVRRRALREGWSHFHVSLIGSEALPLSGVPEPARREALELLKRRGIAWHGGREASSFEEREIRLKDGASIAFDACWVVTGAAAPKWPETSGIGIDAQGFVRVTPTLQSRSHPNVFAAGDIASHATPLPKSGVYAVRAGEALAANLRLACAGEPPVPWNPQSKALYLISTGERHAMAVWGKVCLQGAWLWKLKHWIDTRYVRSKSRRSRSGHRP
ncbi:FAD-dependent oxidoreductase [Ramlibacter sp.]|uniref:FAD-dependent oxidoreductase n=1 Tax=Ramlibacter sp. TaxID=1917967 RepID=UPI003D121F02